MQEVNKAKRIKITGIVQGVGFRPHVYRQAMETGVMGWVLNSSTGVVIEVEGSQESLERFAKNLIDLAPPLAMIQSFHEEPILPGGWQSFTIRESEHEEEKAVMISPDIAICQDCRNEVADPEDRRFQYAFTNCTNCGPRFTIIKDVPYDRALTTMAPFVMCPECREEYENPLHRRFHAQPNACSACGPALQLLDAQGNEVGTDPRQLLKQGCIIAVKGLGGFHLAADARRDDAVQALRSRKKRDTKPFAVMARDMETVKKYCHVTGVEAEYLTSPQAPIVIMERNTSAVLPDQYIHPGLHTLGVMLPYTPLHFLLFDDDLELLIMTSANITDDPLITDNSAAIEQLSGIADYFLMHNRLIHNPCDDSVLGVLELKETVQTKAIKEDRVDHVIPLFFRRARGYVPRGITLPFTAKEVLAVGGEMKNTFCMTRGQDAFLSQHLGDMNYYLNYQKFLEALPRFQNMLAVAPRIIAHDLHPNYQTAVWARSQEGMQQVPVQHHYAHMASAMAENGLTEPVLGLVCDGTGWGTDAAIWGCEILYGGYHGFQRMGHLKYLPLPGGDATVKRPYRMGLVYLMAALGDQGLEEALQRMPDLSADEANMLKTQIEKGLGTIPTSSCGRLFDAVAAVTGICAWNRYEGQAAVELEAAARLEGGRDYSYTIENEGDQRLMSILPAWPEMLSDLNRGTAAQVIAGRFHRTLAAMLAETVIQCGSQVNNGHVVLSGGVFYNRLLLTEVIERLSRAGFTVYSHRLVPAGDAGISLGQAIIASEVID